MLEKLLHTPEGVRDIYDSECRTKMAIEQKLQSVFQSYGYRKIQTPTFEFFDVFNQERGSVHSNEMYKFFDRENNTLVLRPDMTPSIARCVAQYYAEEKEPIRLYYNGNTFLNNSRYQGKLKELTHLGAELILDGDADADAEILAMVIEGLLATGLKEFQIVVGEVGFFKGIVEAAGISEEHEEALRQAIETKNYFALTNVLDEMDMDENTRKILMEFQDYYGGLELLDRAKGLTKQPRSIAAIERLQAVYRNLSYYGYQNYISFDLGMLSQYHYYTGIIFKAYTYGTGDAIVTGGRYDNLLKQFGKDAPSIGFTFLIDELMMALSGQKLIPKTEDSNTLILYCDESREMAIRLAGMFRKQGLVIELLCKQEDKSLEYYTAYGKTHHIGGILYLENKDEVTVMGMADDTVNRVSIDDMMKGMNV
ncbi:MAG: ATP phosphoribosyltransferase regulatory subunit [Lachnospiraceae bacterium]